MTADIIDFDSLRRRAETAADKPVDHPPGGGDDGGMPPELPERVARIEASVATMAKAVETLVATVGKLGDKIDSLADKVGALGERVAAVEGQLKHIPTIWTMLVGQVVAAAVVAGIVVSAFNLGASSTRPVPPTSTQQAPR